MAFGNIGRLCDLPSSALGEEVETYPETGAKYRIFDSAPDSTRSRTFHVTGFEDGCPRQFTGALAMFGDVGMHEAIHFGTPGQIQPETEVDKAYQRVKRQVCKVGKRKPCGDRMGDLRQDTVFLSVYETFGMGGRWTNILLHDGQVEAAAIASNSDQ